MVFSASSSSRPRPGQIFTVGSISWIINADGTGELLEPVQIQSAPIIPLACDCRSDLGSDSEFDSTNNSPPASSLPKEASQQRRSDRIYRSGRTEARHRRIGSGHSDPAPTTLRSRSIGGCSGNSRGYGPALRRHRRPRRRPGQRRPSTRRPDRRPASAGRQHASRRPTLKSASPNHPGGEPGLRVPGLYGDHHRGDHQATFSSLRSAAAQSSTSASTVLLGTAKPRRNAPLARAGTSTVRGAEQRRPSSNATSIEGQSDATSTTNSSTSTATMSTQPQVPIWQWPPTSSLG